MSKTFCNIFVHARLSCVYQVTEAVQATESTCYNSIVVVASFHALFESCIDERSTSSNLGTYDFKLGHTFAEATQNARRAKGESAVDYNTDGSRNFV